MLKKIISGVKKFNNAINALNQIDKSIDCRILAHDLLKSSLTSSSSMIDVNNKGVDKELIVSLTTYSKRIHDVHLVIESIARQTVLPSRLILWLDEGEFTLETIPLILKKQMVRGLEIGFCPNYRSYKKLIPTLQKYPKANIITIDDDVLYPHDMVEMLCREHIKYPETIIGHRVHKIKFDSNGDIMPYKDWEHEISDPASSFQNIAIGVGGVFYPAESLSSDCLDINNFTHLAPNADDIWFKAMSLLNDQKHKKVTDNRPFWNRFLLLQDSQDIGLLNSNLFENGNDSQFKAVCEKYQLYEKLNK